MEDFDERKVLAQAVIQLAMAMEQMNRRLAYFERNYEHTQASGQIRNAMNEAHRVISYLSTTLNEGVE